MSTATRRLSRLLPHGFVSLAFFVFALYFAASPACLLKDTDPGWHIRAGDIIRQSGEVPATDPWSFTAGEWRWYNLSWGYDAVISFLHTYTGLNGLLLLHALLGAALISASAALALRAGANRMALAGIPAVLLCGTMVAAGITLRPQMVTYAMALGFYALLRYALNRSRIAPLYALPPLMLLWANMHGGFPVAAAILGAFFVEAKERRLHLHLVISAVLCALATLATPLGVEIYAGIARSMQGSFSQTLGEWQPARVPHSITLSLTLLAFIITDGLRQQAIPLADRLLALALLMMSFASIRHTPLLGLLGLPFLAQALAYALHDSPLGKSVETAEKGYDAVFTAPKGKALAAAMAALAVAAASIAIPTSSTWNLPVEEIAWIERHRPGARTYVHYDNGGVLIYLAGGRIPVFIDSRAETAYPPEAIEDYLTLEAGHPGWEEVADRRGIDLFLLGRTDITRKAVTASPRWRLLFSGSRGDIFGRK